MCARGGHGIFSLKPCCAGNVTVVRAAVQLRDMLQSIKESLRSDDSAEIRPGPWSLDVHPDEGPIPEPFELEADYDRMMKVSPSLPPHCELSQPARWSQ